MASLENTMTMSNHYHGKPRQLSDNIKSVTVNRKMLFNKIVTYLLIV